MESELISIGTLLEYKAWADALSYRALASVDPTQITKRRRTTFGSILQTMHHMYIVERLFQADLLGKAKPYRSTNAVWSRSLAELAERNGALNEWYIEWFSRQSADDLKVEHVIEFLDGHARSMTREQIAFHVVNHATYHRGFVGDMLRQIPFFWPANDFPVFLENRTTNSCAC